MLRNKLLLLAGTALGLGIAVDAEAAPAFSWTGFYVGGNVGYSFGRVDTTVDVSPFFYAPLNFNFPGTSSYLPLKPNGGIGGVQAGYNWEFASRWLVGLEADLQWSGQRDSAARSVAGIAACTFISVGSCSFLNTSDITARLSWFSTVRGRAGVFAAPNILFYGTAGVAIGEINVSGTNRLTLSVTPGGTATFVTPFAYSSTQVGYAVGAGVEGRFGTSGWTWKVEYLHIDFGSIGTGRFGTAPVVTVTTGNFTDDIVRFGFNYQFAGRPSP